MKTLWTPWRMEHVDGLAPRGLDQRRLQEAQDIIQNHAEEITDAWNRHFRT